MAGHKYDLVYMGATDMTFVTSITSSASIKLFSPGQNSTFQ